MKLKFILIISIGIGILAAIICRGWIDMKNKEIEELKAKILKRGERIAVIAAARPLAQGTVISYEDIGVKEIEVSSMRSDNMLTQLLANAYQIQFPKMVLFFGLTLRVASLARRPSPRAFKKE